MTAFRVLILVAFEKAAGVSIRHRWDMPQIGAAVSFVRNGGLAAQEKELERLAQNADNIAAAIRRALAETREAPKGG